MADIDAKIKAQGDKIRELKNAKTAKDVIDPEQKILLALKAEFKEATGIDWKLNRLPVWKLQCSLTKIIQYEFFCFVN